MAQLRQQGRNAVRLAATMFAITAYYFTLLGQVLKHSTFVGAPMKASIRHNHIKRCATPTLAPAPNRVRPQRSTPLGIDPQRFGERVRWLMDEEIEQPPIWDILLLDKTFKRPTNTVARVAACLTAVLGLTTAIARRKAQHARDQFFAVVESTEEGSEAIRKAQALHCRGLTVRVTPGIQGALEDRDAEYAGSQNGAHSDSA